MSKMKTFVGLAMIATVLFSTSAFAFAAFKKRTASFTVRVENISAKDGLVAADGSRYPFVLSPGFYAVSGSRHLEFLTEGKKAHKGLEAQAEDGDPEMFGKWVIDMAFGGRYGVFNMPVGAQKAGPLLPGDVYEFTFNGTEGMKFNLITMYGQSNDLFYAPAKAINLFDQQGNPLSGDITGEFQLWDAGTEVNEAPGLGAEQAPRQKMKNSGTSEKGVVGPVKDGFSYPATGDVLRVTITAK
ncbi:MAG: spondin domain-containing protein [Pyrinomonadaceae bacterium]